MAKVRLLMEWVLIFNMHVKRKIPDNDPNSEYQKWAELLRTVCPLLVQFFNEPILIPILFFSFVGGQIRQLAQRLFLPVSDLSRVDFIPTGDLGHGQFTFDGSHGHCRFLCRGKCLFSCFHDTTDSLSYVPVRNFQTRLVM